MARLIFDIETNGLLPDMDRVHSLVIKDADSGEVWSLHDMDLDDGLFMPIHEGTINSVETGVRRLMEADQVIGHNIIKFDIPAIQLVYPWFEVDESKVFDTLVCSRLIWPEIKEQDLTIWRRGKDRFEKAHAAWKKRQEFRKAEMIGHNEGPPLDDDDPEPVNTGFPGQLIGRHGLEAWGHRLGLHKGDYAKEMKAKGLDPWAEWNPEMQAYCELDVEVTEALLRKIEEKNFAPTAFELEHRFQWIMWRQEEFGFPFNKVKAQDLERRLMGMKTELEAKLQDAFPPWIVRTPFTPKRDNKTRGYKKGVTIFKEKEVTFNPGSRDHIARCLIDKYKWKPKEKTKEGKPKVDETVLSKLPYPEAAKLSEYLMLTKRLGQLSEGAQAWLRNVGADGRMHGQVVTNGTVTGRCAHNKPNVAQVPSVVLKKFSEHPAEDIIRDAVKLVHDERKGEWEVVLRGLSGNFGYDCRELFTAPKGMVLVGADASGLELRCLAHYMAQWDNGEYGEIVLGGDIHTANQEAAGLPTRANAKTFIYAYLYGAGDIKLGSIVAPTDSIPKQRRIGANLRASFEAKIPALGKLQRAVDRAASTRGYLVGLDGRRLHIRHQHAALNTLLQSAGALAVKQSTILFVKDCEANGLTWGEDYALVAHIHDEMQIAARKENAEHVAAIAVRSFRLAGEHFKFRCPLDGEARIGTNWAETH